jgi:transcription antitermination factor NusA-like protein
METKKIDLIETSSTKEAELARNFLRQLKPIGVKFSEAKEDGNASKVSFRVWVNLPDPKPAKVPQEITEQREPVKSEDLAPVGD